jgi:arylsulfatase A-like enzyme
MLEGQAGSDGELNTYEGRYGEDIWVEKIVEFFDAHRGEPTFVYYPMALPHWPFEPTPNTPNWDPEQTPEESVEYFDDMVEYMDTAVGNLLSGLQSKGLSENTIVIFYSDNGTHTMVQSKLADGRLIEGGKATPKQTGIHVPLIVHWPSHIKPSVCGDLVDASDFVPTLIDLAGRRMPKEETLDGISFAPRLLGREANTRQAAFFWYDPRPGWDKERFSRHVFALNKDYKLFRDGRLFRLTELPLQEIAIDPAAMTETDRAAKKALADVIARAMAGVSEPPLVSEYGEPLRETP